MDDLATGRMEFMSVFPDNTQGVLVQPIGGEGVLIAGTDTQRGFGKLDQVRASPLPRMHSGPAIEGLGRAISEDKPRCRPELLILTAGCSRCRHGSLPLRTS